MSKSSSHQFAVDDLRLRDKRDELLVAVAQPLVRYVIARKLKKFRPHRSLGGLIPCEEDLTQDVLVELTRKLNQSTYDSPLWNAAGFKKYAVRAAENRFNDLLREDQPGRVWLRLKLRRIMTDHPSFAFWKYGESAICGFASWRDRDADSAASARLEGYAKDLSKSPKVSVAFIAALFDKAGGPVQFEFLTNIVAERCGLNTESDISLSSANLPPSSLARNRQVDEGLAYLDLLRAYWKAVVTLSGQQRLAVLLTISDDVGDCWLHHILINRIVTIDEVCGVLEMKRQQLEVISPDLPLDYGRLAELLCTKRANARKLRHRGWKLIEEQITDEKKIFPVME